MNKHQNIVLLEKERFEPKRKSGGGVLCYEVWGTINHGKTVVTRYNLAYINQAMFQSDNGRVLGFDNAHNYHHRHYFGSVEPVTLESYEATVERFQAEWLALIQEWLRKTT